MGRESTSNREGQPDQPHCLAEGRVDSFSMFLYLCTMKPLKSQVPVNPQTAPETVKRAFQKFKTIPVVVARDQRCRRGNEGKCVSAPRAGHESLVFILFTQICEENQLSATYAQRRQAGLTLPHVRCPLGTLERSPPRRADWLSVNC